jgi:hypothetical protein
MGGCLSRTLRADVSSCSPSRTNDSHRRFGKQLIQSVLPQNRLERNSPGLSGLGECGLRVPQIGGIVGRFQPPQILCRDDRRNRLPVAFDDHPFAAVFGATEHIRKSILGFSDAHGGHRPLWPIWSLWTSTVPMEDWTSGPDRGRQPAWLVAIRETGLIWRTCSAKISAPRAMGQYCPSVLTRPVLRTHLRL